MSPRQRLELVLEIEIAFVADAEIEMNVAADAGAQSAGHDRMYRRQSRTAGHCQDRTGRFGPQKCGTERPVHAQHIAETKRAVHISADSAAGNEADMELEWRFARQ